MYKITKWCKIITDDNKDKIISITKEQQAQMPYVFRLLDDDDQIYAYGISSSDDDEEAFKPLDNHSNDYGVTDIQYFKWVIMYGIL